MNLPTRSLCAILVKQNNDLVIDQVELPTKLEVGQVLVKFHYSGICGSQIGEIDGVKGPDKWLPHLLGHEGTGKVLAIGPGVTRLKINDNVIAHWKPTSTGIESKPPKYKWRNEIVNAGFVTTFNEYAVISENRLSYLEESEDFLAATLYGCAVTTGFGVVENKLSNLLGKTAVVFGAGGVGLNVIQALNFSGASEIYAVDLFDERLKLAKRCGATKTINSMSMDVWEFLKLELRKSGLDIFIDNTGNTEIMSKGYDLLNGTGDLVFIGVPKKGDLLKIPSLPLHFGKKITGTHGGEVVPDKDIPRYMRLLKKRNIELRDIITEQIKLKDINVAIKRIRTGQQAGRCIIEF